MRRVISGLALFACLVASGWAWLEYAPRVEPIDVTGTYFRIVNTVDRDLVCATTETVALGGMRVHADRVEFATNTCAIAQRVERTEDTTEGLSTHIELGLICGEAPAGPDGMSATLYMGSRPELTTYIGGDGAGYVPAHASFMACSNNRAP